MSVRTRIPNPDPAIMRDHPELVPLVMYLMDLCADLQSKINEFNVVTHQHGRAIRLPLYQKDNVIGGTNDMRAADYPMLGYIPSYSGDAALVVTDGTYTRAITLGAPIV